jgi:hypothetical protein
MRSHGITLPHERGEHAIKKQFTAKYAKGAKELPESPVLPGLEEQQLAIGN